MARRGITALIMLLMLMRIGGAPVHAAVRLDSDSDAPDNAFGRAVGISGDHAVVGAPLDRADGDVRTGAAYLFRRENNLWERAETLMAPDGAESDFFGHGAAISGDWAIVGAPHHHGPAFGSGAAYVYERGSTGWRLSKKLTAADGGRNDAFGWSVAISGETAVVGAYRADGRGAAYVFVKGSSGWTQAARLTASDGDDGDDFGRSVSVSGDRVVAGAIHHGGHGGRSGAAYVYRRDGGQWVQEDELYPSDGSPDDFFGFSVSVSGDWALIGASADDDRGADAGAAYLFQRNGTRWTQSRKLLPSGASGDFFGRSAALSGKWAVVGADGTDKWGADSGAVYIYEKKTAGWEQTAKLMPTGGRTGDRLGWSVAADNDEPVGRFIFGARDSSPGVAYVHSESADAPHIEVAPSSLTLYQVASSPPNQDGRSMDDDHDNPVFAVASGIVPPEAVRRYWAERVIPPSKPIADALPSVVDWSRFDSAVKSQGGCGSCWAFASVALVENLINQEGISGADDLSEQTILSCSGDGGCRGGWYFEGLRYMSQSGVSSEACHPYEARDDNCGDRCEQPNYLIKIREHTSAMGLWGDDHSVDDMKLALQNGPLIVYMLVPDDGTFEGVGYQGGIYDYQGGSISAQQGHAVLVVGYNDLQKYFLVKNSWGEWWGENGYFRIAYDDVADEVRFGSYAATASGAYMEGAGGFVTIGNSGKTDLIISDIRSNRPAWLGFSPSGFSPISSDVRKSLNIYVSDWNAVRNSTDNTGEITIYTNDPYQAAVSISVKAVFAAGCCTPDDPDKGNLNMDEVVDLRDAIIALKILSGIHVRYPDLRSDFEAADVNGNTRIDLVEAIYALTRASW